MIYEKQMKAKMQNRARMIAAALLIWEAQGEKGVTARNVGKAVGVSGQRVQQLFKTMQALKDDTARAAVSCNRTGVIMQLQASGHPLAPKSEPGKLI
ncbi:TetR/AcrR family transcriptional regulator [candidate division KSB1 bacterium]|nr:TetR/AcrR family transcriptional regulator [candidate division KSB1 bacterium]